MQFPFFIAKKYFFSRKKKSFINFISIISMLGLTLGLTAIIVILSVFNGLEDLNRQVFKSFDPDIEITLKNQKYFQKDLSVLQEINKITGVSFSSVMLEDKALAKGEDAQMIVVIRGVDSTFQKYSPLKKHLLEGQLRTNSEGRPFAVVGRGVAEILGIGVEDFLNPLTLLFPKNQKLNMLNPEENIEQLSTDISGIFELEQQFDNYIYMPYAQVEQLSGNFDKITAIEITLKPEANIENTKDALENLLGKNFVIKDRDQQNAALFRAIKVEKLFIFIGLLFIAAVVSFNIFCGLSMLVLDKKDDIFSLSAMGASPADIKSIFMWVGFIIGFIACVIGLALGLGICFIQLKYGIVGLDMQYAIVDAYPVKINILDIVLSVLGILLLSLLASIIPAKKALDFMKLR